ncbi:hypothetical protein [Thomasclavelia spiroformis]|uniref:hypothetical protein n=1 Tax=Thomasclavelia spiroformis TaxID=29348 RepID=UPI002943AA52|nr:hypothetical protein [Thomasclavelia spiroformis]
MTGTQTYFRTRLPRIFDAYKNEERLLIFEATENFFYVTLLDLNCLYNDQINDLYKFSN